MERQVTRLHRALAVLAPVKRFQLLTLVLEGVDRSVSQLARAVRLSQSCTTRHLQALERAGLVKGWRDGKRVVFRPAPRDAEAGAVIASLSPDAGHGGLHAIPVASTAELEPLPVVERPERARPAAERRARSARRSAVLQEPEPPQPPPESGMNPEPPSRGRYWSEIEDFLL